MRIMPSSVNQLPTSQYRLGGMGGRYSATLAPVRERYHDMALPLIPVERRLGWHANPSPFARPAPIAPNAFRRTLPGS